MRGEGGVVAAAVFGVQDEAQVEHLRFQLGVSAVLAQHIQDIFRGGKVLSRLVDEERGVRMVVLVRLLRIDGEQGELGDELQGLAQNVAFGDVVRFRVVRIEGKHAAGEHIHHVFRGGFHDDVPHEGGGKGAEIR